MTTMNTNANAPEVAALLADARVGTFTGLVTTKKGTVKGGVQYDNDTVHTVVFTGFRYDRLVARSLAALDNVDAADIVAKAAKDGHTITTADVDMALAELRDSYTKTLAGTNESTTAHVYEPLVVDGETVRGARVYKCVAETTDANGEPRVCHCRNCTGDAKAPMPGTIYLQGLRVFNEVLVPAPNGKAPAPKSAAKTIAKNTITRGLPVSKYVSYSLEPGTDFILRAGGAAAVEATKAGFKVDAKVTATIDAAV